MKKINLPSLIAILAFALILVMPARVLAHGAAYNPCQLSSSVVRGLWAGINLDLDYCRGTTIQDASNRIRALPEPGAQSQPQTQSQ